MEINVETAVRICPYSCLNGGDMICVQPNTYNNTVQLGSSQVYPVNYALPQDCAQNSLFQTVASPLLNFLLEGCDVSIVAIGQSGSGKTYTVFGPEFSCAMSESEQGIIPRFIRELFHKLSLHCDRNWSMHVTWSQICGEDVQDLLGTGSVECRNVSDAFQLIQLGMSNIAPRCAHSLFTITLEQQWVMENTIQHRISTASFADLAGCEKLLMVDNNGITQSIPTDPNWLALQRCIMALSEPYNASPYHIQGIPYSQSVLSTLLKDSFGGRAKTLLLCCISPYLRDFNETYYTMQFAMRAQAIRNIVTLNSYITYDAVNEKMDLFGLQFAANQLFKLVRNAEELFQKMITNGSMSKNDIEQISEWLTLKQECEDCLSESSEPHRSLERIEEEIEDNTSDGSESEIVCDDDANVIEESLEKYMADFKMKTDQLISAEVEILNNNTSGKECDSVNNSKSDLNCKGARGRRTSIHSADELSSALSQTMNSLKINSDNESNNIILEEVNRDERKPRLLKQIHADLQGCEKQINELEHTIQLKERLMQQLRKHKDTKTSAKERIDQIWDELRGEHETVQLKYNMNQNNPVLLDGYKRELHEIEQKMRDVGSIKELAGEDSSRRVVELESSLHTSKKQLEKLKKYKRKEEKRKSVYEQQIRVGAKKSAANSDAQQQQNKQPTGKKSCESLCDRAMLVSNSASSSIKDAAGPLDEVALEAYRHEIRNLRRTREYMLEQKCKLDERKQSKKYVTDGDERKALQYEEAIEGIDLAIEYKNQMICASGCNQHVLLRQPQSQQQSNESSDMMLLERLFNLHENEMRALLHRYFNKIVDLRNNGKRLEMQVVDMECENENLTARVQSLSHTLQRVRLQAERRVLSLQQQHEDNLHLVMRHLAGEADGGVGQGRIIAKVTRGRAKHAQFQFRLPGGGGSADKQQQMEKGNGNNFIAKFKQCTRHGKAGGAALLPRQLLQTAAGETFTLPPTQTKVTKEKNKIIIQPKSP